MKKTYEKNIWETYKKKKKKERQMKKKTKQHRENSRI